MIHRRIILKHFGGWINLVIWLSCLVTMLYVLDKHVFTVRRTTLLVRELKQDSIKHPKAIPDPSTPIPSYYECHITKKCTKEEYSYNIQSTTGGRGAVIICFNGVYIFNEMLGNTKRGLNIAVIDETNGKLIEAVNFDTYANDETLKLFLTKQRGTRLLLMATHDDASNGLGLDAKNILHHFGSNLIDKIRFRDNYAMFGQRGLFHGSAQESLTTRDPTSDFADVASISGCLKGSAIGKLDVSSADQVLNTFVLKPVKVNNDIKKVAVKDNKADTNNKGKAIVKKSISQSKVKLGEDLPNCGIEKDCDKDTFAVHLYTGKGNNDAPKICVNGKYVLANNLNDAGRGMNVAVVNADSYEVERVGVFDLYAKDGNNLEIFLEVLKPKEIILAVVNDDASKHLNEQIWSEFDKLGSSFLRKLVFRSGWLFIGQVGIAGHTVIEEIELAGAGNAFPNPIEKRLCLPKTLKSVQAVRDMFEGKNEKRRNFCRKYMGYTAFCDPSHIDRALKPQEQTDDTLRHNLIYSVPIIIVPGLNYNILREQMEALLQNRGLDVSMVSVVCHKPEVCDLSRVFSFNTLNITLDNLATFKYMDLFNTAMHKSFNSAKLTAKSIIFLEEEMMPTPDMLEMMADLYPVVIEDNSLAGITAWNDNGYSETSSLMNKAYRTQSVPGLAFLLKKSFYDKFIVNNLCSTCTNRTYIGWTFPGSPEMLVPDVSRVTREKTSRLSSDMKLTSELFNRKRMFSTGTRTKITDVENLSLDKYDVMITNELLAGHTLETTNSKECLNGNGLGFYIPHGSGKVHIVYFEQSSDTDYRILDKLCKCFKLFSSEKHSPRGLHANILRFSMNENHMYLVGSKSKFFKSDSTSTHIVRIADLT